MASKVSGVIEQIQPGGSNGTKYAIASTAYGYCTTAANEQNKTVEMTDFKLNEGVTIHIKFQYGNTNNMPTLNVQGTGAKSIIFSNSAKDIDGNFGWHANEILTLTYDGTSWLTTNSAYATGAGYVLSGNIKPIASKTFSGFYATANNDNRKMAFFGTITRTDANLPWRIRLKIKATIPNYPSYAFTDWDIDYWGFEAATKAQYIKVNHGTNYALYSLQIYYPKDASDNNILIGVYIYANNNYNNSAYARTLAIDYLSGENCSFTFNDTLLYRESVTVANYTAVGITLTSTGYQETGDTNSNDTSLTYERYNHTRVTCTTIWPRYCLAFTHPTDSSKVIPVNATENKADDTKATITSEEFSIFEKIYYKSSAPSTVLAANSLAAVGEVWYAYSALDLRYSFNLISTSLVAHKDVYLVCNLVTPITATLRGYNQTGTNASTLSNNLGPITQTLPSTDDGYIYIKLGRSYSAYQITLTADHPIYWYKNGALQEYSGYSSVAGSVAWANVSGHPTNLNEFTNGPGYVTSSGVTSITLKAGAGITLDTDNTAITNTGTRTISISGINTSSGSETTCLTAKGTWKTFGTSNLTIGTTNSTAMAGNTTVTNVAISADTTTNKNYALVFGTTASDGTSPTAAKTEGLQKNSAKFYVNPNTGALYATKLYSGGTEVLTTHNNLVKQTAKTSGNFKLLASAQASPSSGTAYEAVYDAKIYMNTTNNQLIAGGFIIHDKAATPAEKVTLQWNSTDSALEFVFA